MEENKEVLLTQEGYDKLEKEFDNYKKRSSKERESMYSSLVADIVSGFLPVVVFEESVG